MKKPLSKVILLVEDETILALTEATMLEKYGYTIITAISGEEAIEIVTTGRQINLILMDIDLGDGLDGPETAEIILKIRDVPIVFLSSMMDTVMTAMRLIPNCCMCQSKE